MKPHNFMWIVAFLIIVAPRSTSEELEWIVDTKAIEQLARIEYKQELENTAKNDMVKRAELKNTYKNGKEQRKIDEFWRWVQFTEPEVGRIPMLQIYVHEIVDATTFIAKQAPDQRDFSVGHRMAAGGPTQGIVPGQTRTYSYGRSIVKGKKYPGVTFKGWDTRRFKPGTWQRLPASTLRVKYNTDNKRYIQRIDTPKD